MFDKEEQESELEKVINKNRKKYLSMINTRAGTSEGNCCNYKIFNQNNLYKRSLIIYTF
tara:strand:- start:160 stop:336 length:177 start_codon:yes stop_codon:yes gene_type:complete